MPNQTTAIRVASATDLKEGSPLCVTTNGKRLALFKINGTVHAIDNTCAHAGGPLCEGSLKDDVVTCPWHGSQFKVDTGKAVGGPAKTGVATYRVEIRGTDVYVVLDSGAADAKPKQAVFSFDSTFDADRPFADEDFLNDLLGALKFPFKLYGILPFVVISQSADEVDVYLGEVHITEMDLQKMSGVMKALNEKWKTDITYCIFHTEQFPGVMLLNIRGPKAPQSLENTIEY